MPHLQNFLLLRRTTSQISTKKMFIAILTNKMLTNVAKNNKTHFSVFYTLIKLTWVFEQAQRVISIL